MAFFQFRTRGPQANEGRNSGVPAPPAESVEAMRRRARHRLVGAAVLVLIGVVGFPLLFDTQPRPVSVDIPIEIPDRNKTKPLPLPAAPAPVPSSTAAPPANPPVATRSSGGEMITEMADGTEVPASRPAPSAAPVETKPPRVAEAGPEPRPEAKPEPKPEPKPRPEPKPEARAEAKPDARSSARTADDAARVRALLEGKSTTAAAAKPTAAGDDSGRFVVQVGAFADADKAREVRQKLEKAGLKTYTNVAKTADGERTRVRVGPFGTRAEADKAAGKVKGLSLSAAVLSL